MMIGDITTRVNRPETTRERCVKAERLVQIMLGASLAPRFPDTALTGSVSQDFERSLG